MADILIIDDDQLICEIVSQMMQDIGHQCAWALTGQDGLSKANDSRFDIIFLDVYLPDANGLDLIKTFRKSPGSPEVIIITGENHPDGAAMAVKSGAWDYLEKPFLRQELELQVKRALQFRREKGDISTPGLLNRHLIIGSSEQIEACLEKVSIAAYSDDNILISGEAGTGKKLFSKTIHLNSDRKENNFVVIDCAALRPDIVENMLFGCEQGEAGSENCVVKKGLIEYANNGTLFLNEISRLRPAAQKSLHYVLDHLRFRPVGAGTEKMSNFRAIATTSIDLEHLVRKGNFNNGLYEKLKGLSIRLPALREIRTDLVKIAFHYIDQVCKKNQMDTKGVSPEFIEIIKAYDWPGNVAELIGALKRAVAAAKYEPTLYSVHLPSKVKTRIIKHMLNQEDGDVFFGGVDGSSANQTFPSLKKVMEDTQKQYLENVFLQTNGNVKKASEIAGISTSAMYARLKQYRIHS